MSRTPRTPSTPGYRRLPRLLLAPALAPGLFAGGAGGIPAVHALALGDPASCAGFVQRYFASGLPAGSSPEAFSLTTESITTEATYAEARAEGTGLSLSSSGAPFFTTMLRWGATEYVSTQRFNQIGSDNPGDPFSPKATRPLEVTIAYRAIPVDGRSLSVSLTWAGVAEQVTPVGCAAANLLYGTVGATLGPTKVVALSLGKPVPPSPQVIPS
jgi:hypothetical protein